MNGKGTDTFKTAIQNYLEYRAATDELFAPLFANPNKSIDECCKYIICEVHKSGMNGFDDDEIFGMAVHYYDENEIEVGNPPQCRIISNVHTDLTEEEKKAVQELVDEIAQINAEKEKAAKYAELIAKLEESAKAMQG